MKRPLLVVFLALAATAGIVGPVVGQQAPVDCSFPISATDATGATVTVSAEPERVVVLAPSGAQTMWAIGAREKVVGMPVNRYTAYLDDREGVQDVVGEDGTPIQETVVDLEPDLVLAPNVIGNDTVRGLRDAGLRVFKFRDATSLADVSAKTELTGRLVGEFEAAALTSAETRGVVAAVREAVADEPRPRVYYALGGGWTAGSGTFIDDLIDVAGGTNVATSAGIDGYAQISPEVVAERNPQVIVVHEGAEAPTDSAVANTTAMSTGSVVSVEPNYINQPGPRVVDPLRELAVAFHPEAYAAADVANATVPEPTRCAGATDTATPTATATTDGAAGPGLTGWQVAVAVAVLSFLALRRR